MNDDGRIDYGAERADYQRQEDELRARWEADAQAQAEYAEWCAEIDRKAAAAYRVRFTFDKKHAA